MQLPIAARRAPRSTSALSNGPGARGGGVESIGPELLQAASVSAAAARRARRKRKVFPSCGRVSRTEQALRRIIPGWRAGMRCAAVFRSTPAHFLETFPMTRHSPILAALAVAAIALAGCHKTPATNTAYNNSGSSATPGSSTTASTTTSSDTTTSPAASGSSISATSPSTAPTGDTSSPTATTSSTATASMPGGPGNVVTDTVQTGKIKAAFASETGLKDADISVDTKDGVVTLSGTAKSREQIALATSV